MIFTVHGEPVSQGSHKAFVVAGKARITDTKKGLKPWRAAVAAAAAEVRGEAELLDDPVQVRVRFIFARPKAHYGTGRNAEVLKDNAPEYVTSHSKGDLDKHLRSILDALTGVVFRDDSQVSSVEAVKVYGSYSHAIIEVSPIRGIGVNPPKV